MLTKDAIEGVAKIFYNSTNKNWGGLPTAMQDDFREVARKAIVYLQESGYRKLAEDQSTRQLERHMAERLAISADPTNDWDSWTTSQRAGFLQVAHLLGTVLLDDNFRRIEVEE